MKLKIDYTTLDWTLSDKELAAQTGISKTNIYRQRHLTGNGGPVQARNNSQVWRNLNWHRTNGEIAEEMGVQETTVAVQRCRYANGIKAVRKLGKRQAIKQAAEELRESYRHCAQAMATLIARSGSDSQKAEAAEIWKRYVA